MRSGLTITSSHGETIVLISLLTLSTFLTQFVFRGVDDNALTSWRWVFADADLARMCALLVVGIVLAYVLSRVPLPGRQPAAVLALGSFLIATVFWREPEVIVDAARYFTQAKHLATYGIGYFVGAWGGEIGAWTDLPLIPLLFGAIFRWGGETRVLVQLFTTLLFSGTVVLTYLIGKTLWDETVGVYAGALLLGMPYLLTQVPLMLVDVPTMFFLTLATFTALRALERGGAGWMALAPVAAACAMLSKYSAWVWLTVFPIVVLVHLRRGPGTILLRAGLVALAAACLVGAVALVKYDVIAEQIRFLQRYQVPGLRRWRESFVSTFLFQIHPFVSAAALGSVVVAVRRRDWKYAIIGWLVLLVLVLQVERIRYLLVVFPMVALMASYALREIGSAEVRRFAASCIVVSSLVVAVFAYLPHLTKMSAVNLKEAGRYLNSMNGDTVEVVALAQVRAGINPAVSVPLLDLFTSKRIVYRPLPVSPQARDGIERSPLRFTWEFRSPNYYTPDAEGERRETPIVIISSQGNQPLPEAIARRVEHHRVAKAFDASDEWFHYQTLVRIYQPAEGAPTGRGE